VVGVLTDKVSTERHRQAGPVHAGYQFWRRLGLEEILKAKKLSRRSRELICTMVLNRLVAPKAEHAMPAWLETTAVDDVLDASLEGVSEDAFYRAMDRVYPHRQDIESELVNNEVELFNLDRTVFFYDLTSTYFEGLAFGNTKAKRGYSRDKRPDCKQVVVALVVNRDGFPLLHEVFEGNTQDRSTLGRMLKLIDERIGLQEGQTVVVDRGMAYPENLDEIRNHPKKLHYIVATRQSERDQWLDDFEGLDGFEEVIRKPSPRNPFQKKSSVRVKGDWKGIGRGLVPSNRYIWRVELYIEIIVWASRSIHSARPGAVRMHETRGCQSRCLWRRTGVAPPRVVLVRCRWMARCIA